MSKGYLNNNSVNYGVPCDATHIGYIVLTTSLRERQLGSAPTEQELLGVVVDSLSHGNISQPFPES
jgi:hypothetical protein